MEKRTVLAIGLSLLVLLAWSAFVSKTQPIDNKIVAATEATAVSPAATTNPQEITLPQAATTPAAPVDTIDIRLDNFELRFIEANGSIKEAYFSGHKYILPLGNGLAFGGDEPTYKLERKNNDSLLFVAAAPYQKITKKFIFPNSPYIIELELRVENTGSQPINLTYPLYLGTLNFVKNPEAQFQDVAIASSEKTQHLNGQKNWEMSNVKFVGMRERYFCAILDPVLDNSTAFVRKDNGKSFVGLFEPDWTILPGKTETRKFRIYIGPQELRVLNNLDPGWGTIIYYGTFDFIAQILLQSLEFIHKFIPNWGWAIIVFSLLIYLVLYPLTLKQMRSMKEMQALQPKIEALRLTYKDNPQRLNKEIMELYREHKVNPLGGCLPLLLQMPIFFALYQVLMRSVALHGASFLWIKDLSGPDKLLVINGFNINILPILMALGMFVQQRMSIVPGASSEAATQQKMMLFIMPIMFGFIFYNMPAGLVLYWFINSALMLIYQMRTKYAK
jgi:YidC/Oxa1 family membrane protein insertase